MEDPKMTSPSGTAFTYRFEADPNSERGRQRLRITGVVRALTLAELADGFGKMEARQLSVRKIWATRTGIAREIFDLDWINKANPAIWGAVVLWDGVLDHDVLLTT